MKKSEKILLVLVIVAGIAMIFAYLPDSSRKKVVMPVSAAPLHKLDDFTKDTTKSVYAFYNQDDLTPLQYLTRDPFQPPMAAVTEPAQPEYELDIELAGIFETSKGRFAIVNEKRLVTGDSINGAKIDRIEHNGIYVSRMGKSFFVPIRKPDLAKSKSNEETSNKPKQ